MNAALPTRCSAVAFTDLLTCQSLMWGGKSCVVCQVMSITIGAGLAQNSASQKNAALAAIAALSRRLGGSAPAQMPRAESPTKCEPSLSCSSGCTSCYGTAPLCVKWLPLLIYWLSAELYQVGLVSTLQSWKGCRNHECLCSAHQYTSLVSKLLRAQAEEAERGVSHNPQEERLAIAFAVH